MLRETLVLTSVLLGSVSCAPDEVPPGGAPTVDDPSFLVIAHRGASAYEPEHTFAAWDLALEMGADYLEQDLRLTADSVLVVLHDETLDRTASGPADLCSGPVRDRTVEELRSCEVGRWHDERRARTMEYAVPREGAIIPTLDSVLTRYAGRARFYIETKAPESAPGMEEALVDLLRSRDLLPVGSERAVIVQSFSEGSLRRIRSLDASIPLVQLVAGDYEAPLVERMPSIAEYAVGIGPPRRLLDEELVRSAHEACLDVHPYTVNDVTEMRRLLDLGVDGFFTDAPDRATRLRATWTGEPPSRPRHCEREDRTP